MTTDKMVSRILDSYNQYGGINMGNTQNFPNRQNVNDALQEFLSLLFPGFRTAEKLDEVNLRYVIGSRVNKIVSVLTCEIQKAMVYLFGNCNNFFFVFRNLSCTSLCFKFNNFCIKRFNLLNKSISWIC